MSQVTGCYTRFNVCIDESYKIVWVTVLWIYVLTSVLLVQGRGEMAHLPAVTAVLLHHIAMDIWADGSVVSTG
jgi:hypothetical protein